MKVETWDPELNSFSVFFSCDLLIDAFVGFLAPKGNVREKKKRKRGGERKEEEKEISTYDFLLDPPCRE